MNEQYNLKKEIKNIKGQLQYKKTILDYSNKITTILLNNPEFINELLNNIEITLTDFLERLGNIEETNITFYDQTLYILLELEEKKKMDK